MAGLTDFEYLENLPDDEIDYSEIPEITEEQIKKAKIIYPKHCCEKMSYTLSLAIIELLWDKDYSSDEEYKLLESACDLVEEYEKLHYPLPIPNEVR